MSSEASDQTAMADAAAVVSPEASSLARCALHCHSLAGCNRKFLLPVQREALNMCQHALVRCLYEEAGLVKLYVQQPFSAIVRQEPQA